MRETVCRYSCLYPMPTAHSAMPQPATRHVITWTQKDIDSEPLSVKSTYVVVIVKSTYVRSRDLSRSYFPRMTANTPLPGHIHTYIHPVCNIRRRISLRRTSDPTLQKPGAPDEIAADETLQITLSATIALSASKMIPDARESTIRFPVTRMV